MKRAFAERAELAARWSAQAKRDGKLVIVAHIGADLFGGAERAILALLTGLQQRGHRVTVACNYEIVAKEAARRLLPSTLLPLRGDLVLSDAWRFAQFLKAEKPDVLLIGTYKKIWLGGLAARIAGVNRVIARVGLASHRPRRLKYRYAIQHWIHHVVLNAESMREQFLAQLPPSFDAERVTTIHAGVTAQLPGGPPGKVRAQLGIPEHAHVIGAVARLATQKRLDRLIDLVARLDDVHAVIAGGGSERTRLQEHAANEGVADRVHLLGHREDRADVLAALDLYIVTSEQEGLSNAMLEALAAGVPVISFPVSGAHEALDASGVEQAAGIVLPEHDLGVLTDAVQKLLSDDAARTAMSHAAVRVARERFDPELGLDQWERVLGAVP